MIIQRATVAKIIQYGEKLELPIPVQHIVRQRVSEILLLPIEPPAPWEELPAMRIGGLLQ